MTNTNGTDWITPGAKVVIRREAGAGRLAYDRTDTIKRVTATQVILHGVPAKFRRRDLTEINGGRELVNPDDPHVQLAVAREQEKKLMGAAEFALQQYPRHRRDSGDSARRADVREKLSELLAQMDEVDRLA